MERVKQVNWYFFHKEEHTIKGLSVGQTILFHDGIFIFYVTLRIVVYFGQNFLSVWLQIIELSYLNITKKSLANFYNYFSVCL